VNPYLSSGAVGDSRYRYSLERVWGDGKTRALFIGLNPSTADATHDDPTVRRCVGFARRFGYSGLLLGNLFAARCTVPLELRGFPDPVGPENDQFLGSLLARSDLVIAAWGNHGLYLGRGDAVFKRLTTARCFGLTKRGQPRHPLYVRADTALVVMARR
jgi:hypothetical protein